MSRFGDEDDNALDVGVQTNASCADCGVDYAKATDDPTTWCDPCSDKRDRWAEALEIRLMLKAVLKGDLTQIKEIA